MCSTALCTTQKRMHLTPHPHTKPLETRRLSTASLSILNVNTSRQTFDCGISQIDFDWDNQRGQVCTTGLVLPSNEARGPHRGSDALPLSPSVGKLVEDERVFMLLESGEVQRFLFTPSLRKFVVYSMRETEYRPQSEMRAASTGLTGVLRRLTLRADCVQTRLLR